MATKRLYYDYAFLQEFTAEVLSCEPASAAALANPRTAAASETQAGSLWRVNLDRTAFYPTSGGQPHDTGRLGDARVVDVLDEEDEVVHVLDKPIEIGPVKGIIDRD